MHYAWLFGFLPKCIRKHLATGLTALHCIYPAGLEFNLFRHCRKDEISFDIVAETGNIAAKNGNNVEATFDTVERIVQLVAFDNVASTLLQFLATLSLVWTGLS